jgi:hypothetical protein
MRYTLAYTSARILLFIVTAGVLYLAGARGLLLLGLALVISGIVSFVVLSRQRDAMSAAIAGRISGARDRFAGFRSRIDAGAGVEDDDRAP